MKNKQNQKKHKNITIEKIKSTFQNTELVVDSKKASKEKGMVDEDGLIEDRDSDSEYNEGDEMKKTTVQEWDDEENYIGDKSVANSDDEEQQAEDKSAANMSDAESNEDEINVEDLESKMSGIISDNEGKKSVTSVASSQIVQRQRRVVKES